MINAKRQSSINGNTTWLTRAKRWLMTELDRARDIRLALFDAYVLYDVRPRPEKLEMMLDLLDGYSAQQVRAAIRAWMLQKPEPGHKPRPPMPNELIALINPTLSVDEEAAELAGALQGMVTKWGNPHGHKARAELPDIAWDVMKANYGCWESFCATSMESNMETRRAQLRGLFAAALRRQKAQEHRAVALPAPAQAKVLAAQGGDMASVGAVAQALFAPAHG